MKTSIFPLIVAVVFLAIPAGAAERHIMQQLVPADKLAEARALTSPLPRYRTEGEVFWVIKNGSAGTGMVGFSGQLTDTEIWSVIQYIHTFSGEHGSGMMGRGEGMGPMIGPGGGMGGMDRR